MSWELSIRTIPLWPRANGEVERQNKSLLKAIYTRGPY